MPFRLALRTLAARLMGLIVIVALLAGSLVGAVAMAQTREAMRAEILQHSLAAADLAAALTAEYFSQTQADAREFAMRPSVQKALADGNYDQLRNDLQQWLPEHPHAMSVAIADFNGVTLATGRLDQSPVGQNFGADRDFLMNAARTGQPNLGGPGVGLTTRAPRIPYAVPLRDPEGNLKAALVTSISLDALSTALNAVQIGQNAHISVYDLQRNIVLADFDHTRLLQPTPHGQAVQRLLAGEHGAVEGTGQDGQRAMAAFAPVPGGPWGIVIQQPATDAFAALQDLSRTILLLVVVSVGLAVIAGALLALHITRPLRTLRHSANAMADGQLERRTGIDRTDEIGQLARSFDHMAESLERQHRDRKRVQAELVHQANHDALTGLPNRARLNSRLEASIVGGETFALCILDLDGFKEINDTLGHDAGDVLLREVAGRLTASLPTNDLVARLGGDEFALLLSTQNAVDAARVADQVARLLAQGFEVSGQRLDVQASVGIAMHPIHGTDTATLLRRADVAMYVAKRMRSRCVVFADEMEQNSTERLSLLADLRHAIESDELVLYYQPKRDLRRGKVSGAEALVRWQRPGHGLIAPDRFIPLAEQTGLIGPLSDWVLQAAIQQAARWQRTNPELRVAVNLSMRNLLDPHLAESIAAQLERWPARLDVEITESALMADPERALATLSALSDIGVRIAIDDFGTGYSSLAHLKRLPVDVLKIDRSFVRDIRSSANDRIIVRSTVELAHNLGLRVVAEGVEDSAAAELLREFGCDEIQGYYLSRPVPAPEFERWLIDSNESQRRAA